MALRIYGLMSDYPKVFSKISGFMLADVMSFLQSVTLLPSVKVRIYGRSVSYSRFTVKVFTV